MGNILSAINNDELDWQDFKREAGINNIDLHSGVWNNPYSQEAVFAREGYCKFLIMGKDLIEYVGYSMLINEIKQKAIRNSEEYKQYLHLKNKYERN